MARILAEVHFLLFSQGCLLRNTADLLDFMLHRLLSIAAVKVVCSRCNSSQVEKQVDVWQLSVLYLVTKSKTGTVFHFSPLKKVGINVNSRYEHSVTTRETR